MGPAERSVAVEERVVASCEMRDARRQTRGENEWSTLELGNDVCEYLVVMRLVAWSVEA